MEQKIKGGTIIGLVAEQKPVEGEAQQAEPKPKKGKAKTKGEG